MMKSNGFLPWWQHPLAFNSSRHWRNLRRANGGVDPEFRFRAAIVTALGPLTAPLRALERLCYGGRVAAMTLAAPPIFIVGFWRSGTTHLHNLMSQDPALGFVSTLQATMPETCLLGRHVMRPFMRWAMPPTRPMDNVAFSPDFPQEDEYAICSQSLHSLYNSFFFPKNRCALFKNYALFDGLSPQAAAEWQAVYLEILKKATLLSGGRRLVLKNPVNTGRTPVLRDLFPGAKFIHIHRDPHVVFRSFLKFAHTLRAALPFQHISDQEIEDALLSGYAVMMRRYLEDRSAIPEGNLVEVRYEDLEQQPMEEMRRVYETLCLPGWEKAEKPMANYLKTLAGYTKNRFSMPDEDRVKIRQHWRFALETWGYDRA